MNATARLSARDFDALWRLVHELHGVLNPEAFVRLILSEIPLLIASDITTFDQMCPSQSTSRHWITPEAAVPTALMPMWEHVMHAHPVLDYMLRTGDTTAHKISDFATREQFRNSMFYNEWYKRLGIEHALNTSVAASLAQGVVVGVGLHRRTKDFTERDRTVLNLLRLHLVQAYQNSLILSGLTAIVDHRHGGAIVLGQDGRVLMATASARTALKEYFADGDGPLLPEPLVRWVDAQIREFGSRDRLPAPRRPLVVDRPGRRLVIHFVQSAAGLVLQLTEEHHAIPREALVEWKLTDREAEVLGWLVEGKTNAEIAGILSVRARTVEKHCERVYQKLGVENRTAAVRRVVDCTPVVLRPIRPTHATTGHARHGTSAG